MIITLCDEARFQCQRHVIDEAKILGDIANDILTEVGENDHWSLVECLLMVTREIHIGLVGAIPRNPVIIDTTAEALREHIAPRKFRGYFRTERKRITVEGDARHPQP